MHSASCVCQGSIPRFVDSIRLALTFDHAADAELGRGTTRVAAVELLPVDQGTTVEKKQRGTQREIPKTKMNCQQHSSEPQQSTHRSHKASAVLRNRE
jgi:hypothetical protein